jgi:hypothetical protein
MELLRRTIFALQQKFSMKDLEPLHHFLGITVERRSNGMFLHQCIYTLDILKVAIHHPLKTMLSTSKPLEHLHMDLFGLTSYKSIGGNLYCLVIVDDYSRYTWTLFLGDKSETPEIFKTFARRAQ